MNKLIWFVLIQNIDLLQSFSLNIVFLIEISELSKLGLKAAKAIELSHLKN